MMALSLQASPTLPSLNLGNLMPTPTIPDIAGEVQSMITSVIDGITTLIPTMVPTPAIASDIQNMIPGVTVAIAAPTPPPEVEVLAKLAQGALDAFPSMLMKNLQDIQSMASSAIAAAVTATPTPVTYVTTEDGKECTKTSFVATPTFATTGVINPLSILANALPQPSGVMNEVTSVIGGVTSVLKLPSVPLPTGLLPLLGSMQLPQIDLPMLMGDKQNACIKDGNGNQIGLCGSGPLINDSETIAL